MRSYIIASVLLDMSSVKSASFGRRFSSSLLLIILVHLIFLILVFLLSGPLCTEKYILFSDDSTTSTGDYHSPTNLNHLAFCIGSSEKTYRLRKSYLESWWRPGKTRGYIYLDKPPGRDLLPWSEKSPPYRISDNISELVAEINPINPVMPRIFHGIWEVFREEQEGLRWLIMGDDDTVFFLDNLVDVLSEYDHTKYYYIGYPSEYLPSNYWFSFHQGFGGGGIILSYPLVKVLVNHMGRCLRTYSNFSSDLMIMSCLADFGVHLTPHKGLHQLDFKGDVSGFLSCHPKDLVLSLHHMDTLHPYFPSMDREESLQHLMKAGSVDQSRLFQQTICYHRDKNWSISISWGYSAHVYERIMPRSWLITPIETFETWRLGHIRPPPYYMFDTRSRLSHDPSCEAPHIFFFESIQKIVTSNKNHEILTIYSRSQARNLSACDPTANHFADYVSKILVFSPPTKRTEIGRAECCDVVRVDDTDQKVEVKFRECIKYETVAL